MAKWHEFRESRKKAKEASQAETAPSPEGAEVVGWGVQEADARTAQEGASKSTFFAFPSPCFGGEPDANTREKKAWRRNSRWRTPFTRASSLFACR